MRGQLGGGHKVLLALAGGDGKKRFALQQRWSSGEVIFKIPKSVPIGSYGLTIVDIQSKPLSNEIRVNLVRTQEEWLAHCATKANRDADGDGSLNWDCGGNDCNDANPRVAPEFTEVCDDANLDEDCDPSTFGDQDLDGDRHVNARCCNGTRCGADCDDTKRTAHPDSPEVCNTRDDDCDGLVDEGMTMTAFRDNDKDLYGDAKQTVTVCSHMVPKGFVTNDLDCDDTNVAKNPRGGCP